MKGFKKLALVAAIAAPFSSVHALEAIDDSMLSDMTGQAGVTIDLQTQVSIDSVTWTDTADATNANDIGGGSVVISDIKVGGHDAANDALSNIRLEIDAASGVQRTLAGTETTAADSDALRIKVTTQNGAPVELGLDVGSVALGGWTQDDDTTADTNEAVNLMSNIDLNVTLAPQLIVVHEAGAVANIDMSGYFRVDSSSLTVDAIGADITGLRVGQIDFNEDGTYNAWAAGNYLADNYGLDKEGDASAAGPAAVAAGMAYYELNVKTGNSSDYTADADGNTLTGTKDALIVSVANFDADIAMESITLGGASIGSVGIDNLSVTNTSMTIYGH